MPRREQICSQDANTYFGWLMAQSIFVFQGQDADIETTALTLGQHACAHERVKNGIGVLSLSYTLDSRNRISFGWKRVNSDRSFAQIEAFAKLGAAAQHRQRTGSRPSISGRFGGIEH
jgi:hypothetical protein